MRSVTVGERDQSLVQRRADWRWRECRSANRGFVVAGDASVAMSSGRQFKLGWVTSSGDLG
jgi:hypothetical protein